MAFSLKAVTLSLSIMASSLSFAGENVPAGDEVIAMVHKMGLASPPIAPLRGEESDGPFERLIIKNATVYDGTGAPAQGPLTIVIEGNTIVDIQGAGAAAALHVEHDDGDAKVIDAKGMYVIPGFVDTHAHLGTPSHAFAGALTDPEYVGKLWLAHGVTTIRDPGSIMGLGWTLEHKRLAEEGKIAMPRIQAYSFFPEDIVEEKEAEKWMRAIQRRGADGVKFVGGNPRGVRAAIAASLKLGMGSMAHHAQLNVAQLDARQSAELGLKSIEHWYGIPEAMFTDRTVQDYPTNYNYNNEQDRFRHAGHLWRQSAEPGSKLWNDTIEHFIELGTSMTPTFSIYDVNRDLTRAKSLPWFEDYAMPYVMRSFQANPKIHGAYHFDWTTEDEIAWKDNFSLWMQFIKDFHVAGGRVTAGSDTGFLYGLYGFGFIRELEMLQEAGLHPLEVLKVATINGAELLGLDRMTGSIEIGKRADLVIVKENPLANFKVLYGTAHSYYDFDKQQQAETTGIMYTVRDGIVFDSEMLLAQVRDLVEARKLAEAQAANAKSMSSKD